MDMAKLLKLGILAVFILTVFFSLPEPGQTGEAHPSIFARETSFDHPDVFEGETVIHDFKIENRGSADLRIEKVETG